MLKITMSVNMDAAIAKFATTRKQVQFGTALALTNTAKEVQGSLKAGMTASFRSVTAYTRNSLYLSAATKSKLEAVIGVKGEEAGAIKSLRPEIFGGLRQRNLEKFLQKIGLPPPGMYAVPGKNAKLKGRQIDIDWVASLVGAILVQGQSGQTIRFGKSKNARKGGAATYFVLKQNWGKLLPGIYGKRGSGVYPYIIFVKQPHYQKKFDFFGIAKTIANRSFPKHFEDAIKRAIATAK